MPLPPSELWSKFQSALVWVSGVLEAGIAVVQRAPAAQPEKIIYEGSSPIIGKPSTPTAGASVEGFRVVNIYGYQADALATYTATVKVWGRAPGVWVLLGEVALTNAAAAAPPLDVEGYARVALEIPTITASESVKICVFPYNVETP